MAALRVDFRYLRDWSRVDFGRGERTLNWSALVTPDLHRPTFCLDRSPDRDSDDLWMVLIFMQKSKQSNMTQHHQRRHKSHTKVLSKKGNF